MTLALLVLFALASVCPVTKFCVKGEPTACVCSGGLSGVQTCQADNSYDACDCSGSQPDMAVVPDMTGVLPPGGKRFFTSSATYAGDLKTAGGGASGLDGADQLCTKIAAG